MISGPSLHNPIPTQGLYLGSATYLEYGSQCHRYDEILSHSDLARRVSDSGSDHRITKLLPGNHWNEIHIGDRSDVPTGICSLLLRTP